MELAGCCTSWARPFVALPQSQWNRLRRERFHWRNCSLGTFLLRWWWPRATYSTCFLANTTSCRISSSYVVTCLWFAYVEGYKGFQTKFAPLVVSRSFTMDYGSSKIHHFLLAPFYSMGLFHATKKRMIVSWSVSLGVAGIVYAVKKLPYPWRNIVDAGVVVGLTWGSVSIVLHYIKALVTGAAPADPALPKSD